MKEIETGNVEIPDTEFSKPPKIIRGTSENTSCPQCEKEVKSLELGCPYCAYPWGDIRKEEVNSGY